MPRLPRRACGFASGGEGFEGDAAGDAGSKGGVATEADLGCCASVEEDFVAAVEAGFGVGAAEWAGLRCAFEEDFGDCLRRRGLWRGCRESNRGILGRGRRCRDDGGLRERCRNKGGLVLCLL
jgi:hypothetical protein